ncbi:uncharacterized protein MELLADRAFT_108132 [Melampsora larici-populina 98AG31]|uniref:Uncharacterized protein n=1 Tax=Melampsora larici-populina (strain 98AG31 / pathotype 3-4-7) TaxID=747676 RepID=F4RS26_MELLP|nr:uncharacterized protein MELLADRAFT_108132 [Melampsora larici-populina 98AG31]EGG04783.1 hypothetical protein MELLADRAFT_108132 [Melampsora larici-populina 98AG31]
MPKSNVVKDQVAIPGDTQVLGDNQDQQSTSYNPWKNDSLNALSKEEDVKPLELKKKELEKLEQRREKERIRIEESQRRETQLGKDGDDTPGVPIDETIPIRSKAILEALTRALDAKNGNKARRLVTEFDDSFGQMVSMAYNDWNPKPKNKGTSGATQQVGQLSTNVEDLSHLLASISGGTKQKDTPDLPSQGVLEVKQTRGKKKKRKAKNQENPSDDLSSSSNDSIFPEPKPKVKKKKTITSSDDSEASKPKKKKKKRSNKKTVDSGASHHCGKRGGGNKKHYVKKTYPNRYHKSGNGENQTGDSQRASTSSFPTQALKPWYANKNPKQAATPATQKPSETQNT